MLVVDDELCSLEGVFFVLEDDARSVDDVIEDGGGGALIREEVDKVKEFVDEVREDVEEPSCVDDPNLLGFGFGPRFLGFGAVTKNVLRHYTIDFCTQTFFNNHAGVDSTLALQIIDLLQLKLQVSKEFVHRVFDGF